VTVCPMSKGLANALPSGSVVAPTSCGLVGRALATCRAVAALLHGWARGGLAQVVATSCFAVCIRRFAGARSFDCGCWPGQLVGEVAASFLPLRQAPSSASSSAWRVLLVAIRPALVAGRRADAPDAEPP
jgi:hypothetical protein